MPTPPLNLRTPQDLKAAARLLSEGELLALPTDTVPGIGVLLSAPNSAAKLAACKGNPPNKPFSLHLGSLEALRSHLGTLPAGLAEWVTQILPGPWTLIVPTEWAAEPLSQLWPHPAIGFRVPKCLEFQSLMSQLSGPVLMSSINQHGAPPLHGEDLEKWLETHPEVTPAIDPLRVSKSTPSRILSFDPLPSILRGPQLSPSELPGKRVLVICTGNICRSPLAHKAMESCLAKSWDIPINKLASTGWTIESAGTFATTGLPATDYSIQVARDLELDLSGHRAQSLSEALEKPWDIILGLTHAHLSDLPEIQGVQLDVLDPTGADISDPYGGSLATYQKMRDEVVNGVQNRVKRWSEWPPT